MNGANEKRCNAIDKRGEEVNIRFLPERYNSATKCLYIYTFKPWKNFLHFSDVAILYNYDINLHLRNNILKIQSLIRNQF